MGGSAREWKGRLPSDLAPGALTLRLVMTKFNSPAVTIAYEVRLQA
ncbi:MAG TPA: hypothetical protein VKI99_05945 [Candidatus Dormibacteraeota bacterium]|nr:hypothetical protein [Candidatus Dormibacteraeota bacterium]